MFFKQTRFGGFRELIDVVDTLYGPRQHSPEEAQPTAGFLRR
jgi:hypothetical protein